MQTDLFIEPCCYDRQLTAIIEELEYKECGRTTATFFSSGDWDLSMLLVYLAARVPCCELTLCLVQAEAKTLYAIDRLMKMKSKHDSAPLVSHVTLITSISQENDKLVHDHLSAWGSDRLTYAQGRIGFRCLTLCNGRRWFVLHGSPNQHAYYCKQLYTISTDKQTYDNTQQVLQGMARIGKMKTKN